MKRKARALVLFSGGLDSMLAVRVLQDQGIRVEALHFTCPFYSSMWARKASEDMGIRLREVPVDSRYFRIVEKPPHGHGSGMNPCIDCKAYMLRRAERIRKSMGFDFLVTGEVSGERPMSQTRPRLIQIERLAGLPGRVVRPLSALLLPPTRAEKDGLVSRQGLLGISGRSRKPQIELAGRYGIREYPAPSGGCLLTDPEYSRRLREHIMNDGSVSWDQGELLKYGRHFRYMGIKIVVGRNREDNESILELAGRMKLARLEVLDHPGPVTVIAGRHAGRAVETAAGLTVRYSDFPGKGTARVEIRSGRSRKVVMASGAGEEEAKSLMV